MLEENKQKRFSSHSSLNFCCQDDWELKAALLLRLHPDFSYCGEVRCLACRYNEIIYQNVYLRIWNSYFHNGKWNFYLWIWNVALWICNVPVSTNACLYPLLVSLHCFLWKTACLGLFPAKANHANKSPFLSGVSNHSHTLAKRNSGFQSAAAYYEGIETIRERAREVGKTHIAFLNREILMQTKTKLRTFNRWF